MTSVTFGKSLSCLIACVLICSSTIFIESCNQESKKVNNEIVRQRRQPPVDNSYQRHQRTDNNSESEQSDKNSESGQSGGLNRNEDHLILTKHAKCRMACRHITEEELKGILHDGKINYNKSELHAQRGPKYAVEGYLAGHQHLRVIFAPEPHAVVVVTCIDLDNEWQCPSCN